MRSRTPNELKQRAKILLTAIQREYDESRSTKKANKPQQTAIQRESDESQSTKKTNKPQQSATSDKENDNGSEKSRDKKAKRKSWMPTISFAVSNGNEPKAKKAPNADGAMAGGSGIAPDAIPSTSGVTKKSIAVRKMSLDMPSLD